MKFSAGFELSASRRCSRPRMTGREMKPADARCPGGVISWDLRGVSVQPRVLTQAAVRREACGLRHCTRYARRSHASRANGARIAHRSRSPPGGLSSGNRHDHPTSNPPFSEVTPSSSAARRIVAQDKPASSASTLTLATGTGPLASSLRRNPDAISRFGVLPASSFGSSMSFNNFSGGADQWVTPNDPLTT
jgi:hypothetical protein